MLSKIVTKSAEAVKNCFTFHCFAKFHKQHFTQKMNSCARNKVY